MKKFNVHRRDILLLSSIILVFTIGLDTPHAFAAPGDFVGTVTFNVDCPSGLGVGIAFDGTDLWYSCYLSGMDLKRADAVTGIVEYETDIVTEGGLGALSYDATRDVIWAGDGGGTGGGGEVYKIQLTGPAGSKTVSGSTLEFDVEPDVGSCGLDDGLAFDARNVGNPNDDRIYYSNDCVTTTIRTFTLAGVLDETFPWTGTSGYNSGLAVGGQLLLQGANGASHVWVVDKTTKSADFDFPTNVVVTDPNFRDEDLECDTVTFAPIHVMWSKEAHSPMRAHAFEFKLNQCGVGGVTGTPVGGEILPINSVALLLGGIQSMTLWMAPVLAGAAGTAAFYLKSRKN